MKAVILSAGRGTRLGKLTESIPKCLLEIKGKTLLERVVSILKKYKINDVTIVIGKKGMCWNQETINKIKSIVPKIVINEENDVTYSGYSCALAMKQMKPQTFLVMDGDVIFEEEALKTLLVSPSTSLLTRPTSSLLESGGKVQGKNGLITYCGIDAPDRLPWDIYSGMMKVGKEIFEDLRGTWLKFKDKEILYGLNFLCKKYEIHMRRIGYYFSKEGGGGSELKVMTIIRKESSTERRFKLANEVRFLMELPEKWRIHFPQVIASKITEKTTYYEMLKYELPSLRRLLFSGVFDHKDALKWIDRILNLKFKEMYPTGRRKIPKDYMDFMHTQRIWKRVQETYDKSPVFRDIIARENLIINGKKYKNIPISLCLLEQNTHLLEKCLPPYVTHLGHFDLHFANILIDTKNDNFILVDPRGYKYCDYYYDLGKIWHSAHGLYDLIAERRFTVKRAGKEVFSYSFIEDSIFEEYKKIERKLPEMFSKYANEPIEDTMRKVQFNEMTHFCSFMPFFFDYDKMEHRALVAYIRGVEFINSFEKRYIENYRGIKWVNINYPRDWKIAGEKEWRVI